MVWYKIHHTVVFLEFSKYKQGVDVENRPDSTLKSHRIYTDIGVYITLERMRYLVFSVLLFVGAAHAGDFSARYKAGKLALASSAGKKYEDSWGAVMSGTMTACIPPGALSPENLGKFAFVGNVSSTGLVSSVEVEPSTSLSRCFALHFNNAQLPPPPASPKADALFPIADEIEMLP